MQSQESPLINKHIYNSSGEKSSESYFANVNFISPSPAQKFSDSPELPFKTG